MHILWDTMELIWVKLLKIFLHQMQCFREMSLNLLSAMCANWIECTANPTVQSLYFSGLINISSIYHHGWWYPGSLRLQVNSRGFVFWLCKISWTLLSMAFIRKEYIYSLMQDCSVSIAKTMEILQSCTEQSTSDFQYGAMIRTENRTRLYLFLQISVVRMN